MTYEVFIERKTQLGSESGFEPIWIPDFLFDFQADQTKWAIRKGRLATFADCGLGKCPMQLVWAENIHRHTNKPVLILTYLAVAAQMMDECKKFGMEAVRSNDGKPGKGITITNYQKLHHFNPNDFSGVACDESSVLKSFDGETKKAVTEFMRKIQYRSLWTATAAPNDWPELGTSSEALGELGYTDMLQRFFKNDQNVVKPMVYRNRGASFELLNESAKWRLKGHAEIPFWQWVCSWARAFRKPSDLGYDDSAFVLPPLFEREHLVESEAPPDDFLFTLPAVGLKEQRNERRRTIGIRCEKMAELMAGKEQALIWCHLNTEGDLLEEMMPDSKQVSGATPDEEKEEIFLAFSRGEVSKLVTKGKIAAWGMNFQNCHRVGTFPSHSFEQHYQGVRRCWRFGQKHPVTVDIVTTEGEQNVLKNLKRKQLAADKMFENLVREMNNSVSIKTGHAFVEQLEIPSWL